MGCTPYASFFLFLGQAHSFLLPPSTLRQTHPPGYAFTPRQKNLQSPPSHMCFRFWTVTRQMKRIKSRHKSKSQESFLKLSCFYLPPKKLIKKQTADRLCMKFPWTPIPPLHPPFHLFCYLFFFREYFNLEIRINKMASDHIINCHTSVSGLTSRTHSLIFQ